MSDTSAVSVVIPLYNKVNHIQRALDSVLAQTFKDFEVIVVNDGSTDGSEKVVERYSDPCVRLVNQENAGVSAARNRGIAEARADLIAFLDADDEWLPGHLQTILRLRRDFPQCGLYATAYNIATKRGEMIPSFVGIPAPPFEGVIPNYFRTVYGNHAVWTSAVAVPRGIFTACGFFPEGEQRREDLDMWCRIALKYPIAYSTCEGALYHQEADSRAVSKGRSVLLTEPRIIRTLETALATGELRAGVTRDDLLEYMNIQLITRAQSIVLHGYRREAREMLWKASATREHQGALRRWMFLSYLPAPLVRLALSVRLRTVALRTRSRGGEREAFARATAAASCARRDQQRTDEYGEERPLLSVVIPLYNKARYIRRALDSVLAQTFEDFEVIVVNDGSTDGSEKVVERYTDPRVRLVSQENVGECAARNRGIAEARANLVAFLDADDEWLPGHLAAISRLAEKYPECGAYCTNHKTVGTDGRLRPSSFTFLPGSSSDGVLHDYFKRALTAFPVNSTKVAIPARVFDECGLFPEGEQEGGDLDMWCRIALKYPIAYSAETGAIYHQECENRVGRRGHASNRRSLIETLENALAAGGYLGSIERADLAEYLNLSFIIRAIRSVRCGDGPYGRELLLLASGTRMFRARLLRWRIMSYLPVPLVRLALGVWLRLRQGER